MSIALWLAYALLGAGLYLSIILAHEFGHAWAYKNITGKKATIKLSWRRFTTGSLQEFKDLTPAQYKTVIEGGLLFGFFQALLVGAFLPTAAIPYLVLYVMGCKTDINKWRHIN